MAADNARGAFAQELPCRGIRFNDLFGRSVDDHDRLGRHLEQQAIPCFHLAQTPIVAFHRLLRLDQPLLDRGNRAEVAPDGDDPVLVADLHRRIEHRDVSAPRRRVVHVPSRMIPSPSTTRATSAAAAINVAAASASSGPSVFRGASKNFFEARSSFAVRAGSSAGVGACPGLSGDLGNTRGGKRWSLSSTAGGTRYTRVPFTGASQGREVDRGAPENRICPCTPINLCQL